MNTIFYTTGPIYTENIFALLGLGIILLLGWFGTRYWCSNLCPLGGLIAMVSKFSLFRFSFAVRCNECSLCEKICPTRAIDAPQNKIDKGECISCLRCLYECSHHSIAYRLRPTAQSIDLPKRYFIRTLIASAALAPLTHNFLFQRLRDRLIRPPGAIPEPDFLNVCIRCGKCMKICPTNGLQPCVFEAGMNGLWTPRLIPRIGGCEKNCNLCGQICPTGAIRKLKLEEKTYVCIGTAVIDQSRCIAWEQNKVCLICDEACPFNAISSLNETILGETLLRPFVDDRICTGCGLCETLCPIDGPAAIQIFSINQERKKTGSYITPEKAWLRVHKEYIDDLPSGFIE
ncbi:hypothetical protein A2Y85_06360 [candidate division WOR-3 bacterium RBG_13_43_14]|uniref:4Fe-4S ferredoxin-type domain-containing protein n=1 Tax=candidate division WOR-3 bacterium RBG_13_43_14 TaxID=1802590 RepID=A0A1F4UCN3_UNCW3|nr:MAG: hypothetical protein A2Y85_06360 [candidate division WOR-3 bacterium RBG_13_43_14]